VKETEHPRDQENQKNRSYTDARSAARAPARVPIVSPATAQQEDQNDDKNQKHISPFPLARLAAGALELLTLLNHLIAGLPARFFGLRRDHLAGLSHLVDGLLQLGRRVVDPLFYVFLVDAHIVLLGFFPSLEAYRHVMRNRAV
jgi:hypothetical protein